MSRSAKVYIKGVYAGLLTEIDREHYSFCYDTDYYNNPQLPAVSLTMPKTQQEYTSSYLFPVFFNMTSEGDNRIIQARNLHIDEEVWDILFSRLFTNFAKKEHGKREHYYVGYRGF